MYVSLTNVNTVCEYSWNLAKACACSIQDDRHNVFQLLNISEASLFDAPVPFNEAVNLPGDGQFHPFYRDCRSVFDCHLEAICATKRELNSTVAIVTAYFNLGSIWKGMSSNERIRIRCFCFSLRWFADYLQMLQETSSNAIDTRTLMKLSFYLPADEQSHPEYSDRTCIFRCRLEPTCATAKKVWILHRPL